MYNKTFICLTLVNNSMSTFIWNQWIIQREQRRAQITLLLRMGYIPLYTQGILLRSILVSCNKFTGTPMVLLTDSLAVAVGTRIFARILVLFYKNLGEYYIIFRPSTDNAQTRFDLISLFYGLPMSLYSFVL